MVRLILLISLIIIPPHQIAADLNCMRTNRGVLDADFNLFNRHENIWNVTKDDVAKQMSLFSTRFNRAHILTWTHPNLMKTVAEGVLEFENNSNVKKQLFFAAPPGTNGGNLSQVISSWKDSYRAVTDIQTRSKDLVVGLYLNQNLPTWSSLLEAIEAAFGTFEDSQFPIGMHYSQCSDKFNNTWAIKVFQRLQFVTCQLDPVLLTSPEDSAADTIKRCDSLRDTARSKNISAEIMCSVEYHSEGNNTNGIVGSVPDFHRFWCEILNEVAQNQSHPRIIMLSAFDYTPIIYDKPETVKELSKAKYHTGWWRRTHITSYEQSLFLEKVGELRNWPMFSGCHKAPTLKELAAAIGEEMKGQGIDSFPI